MRVNPAKGCKEVDVVESLRTRFHDKTARASVKGDHRAPARQFMAALQPFMAVQEMLTMAGAKLPTKSRRSGINGSLRASAVLLAKISHALSESEKREGARNRRQRGSSRSAGNY